MKPIVLITDFGHSEFPGVMEAVIRKAGFEGSIIHLTHAIAPHNTRQAAFILEHQLVHLPADAVIVIVVDPTVGSQRRIVAAHIKKMRLLLPDNGLLTPFLDRLDHVTEVPVGPGVSNTFHGRDIFAPAAVKLALGKDTFAKHKIDPRSLHRWTDYYPDVHRRTISGRIMHIYAFGNCISNITRSVLGNREIVEIRLKDFSTTGLKRYYAEAGIGEPIALFSSFETIEFSVVHGSFRKTYDIEFGEPVELETVATGS